MSTVWRRALLFTGNNLEGPNCRPFIIEKSVASCHQRCLAHPKCQAYTYLTDAPAKHCKNNCFLHGHPTKKIKKSIAVAGPKLCVVEF